MLLGAQMYTLRNYCQNEKDLGYSLEKIAEIGYKTVQISGIGPIPPAKVRALCDAAGLQIVITHTSPDRMLVDIDSVIEDHNIMECKYIGIGSMPERYRRQEWFHRFAEDFQPIAERVKAAGKLLMYHNHDFEFEKYNGEYILQSLANDFKQDEMGFTLDTYWVHAAGCDVVSWIEKLTGRLPCIHLKDMEVFAGKPLMAPVMEGNLDFPKIIKAFEHAGTKFMFVEQDVCRQSPFDCLKISYENLKNLGYQ